MSAEEMEKSEYTDVEQQAMAEGWIPPDRFDADEQGKEFISAEKYLENGSFFKKIDAQKKQIEQLQSSFDQLNAHYQKVQEVERKKAEKEYNEKLAMLKAEKVKALQEGEHERVVEIDEEIRTTDKPPEKMENPEFDRWVAKNDWYINDQFLRIEATRIGEILFAQGKVGADLYEAVGKHIREAYPGKFTNPDREKPPTVESDSPAKQPNKKTITMKDLTADEREVFNNFERMNIFKTDEEKQKYIREVIELRD